MADKKSRGILTVLAIFLFLLAFSLSLFLFFYRIPRLESINYYLTQSDELYEAGKYRQAGDMLEKASSFTQGYGDWKRIIKRGYNISLKSQDYGLYSKFAERGVKLYQGNEEFWVYYLTSLLWSGKYDQLLKYKDRLSGGSYPTIQAEIRLTEESLSIDESLKPFEGVMERLEGERDGEFYELVGDISGIDDLWADAVIIWMGLGDKERAKEAALNIQNPNDYLQLLGLMYWDRKEWDKAVDFLNRQDILDKENHNRRWNLNNILGDGYLLLNDWEKAEYHYLTSREIMEEDNWRPMVNRAMIYEQAGIWKEASRIILEALSLYGNQRDVVLYFLDNWQDTYPVRAERVVRAYLYSNPYDVEVKLEQFTSFPEEMSPERYRAFLWNLFNNNSGNEKVVQYLLWYMAVLGDFDSMQIIMERHERTVGYKPSWYPLYQGLIMALKAPQQPEEAKKILENYYEETHDWFGEKNLAVLSEYGSEK
jgi:hypothetical protein